VAGSWRLGVFRVPRRVSGVQAEVSARVVLAERVSEPLSEDIRIINKFSQNLHVEMLLRTLGRELNVKEPILGPRSDREFCSESRDRRKRSRLFGRLRSFAPLHRFAEGDHQAPSIHGKVADVPGSILIRSRCHEDGTLGDRFDRTSARGNVRAKTGTLSTSTPLGYMDLPSKVRLAFSIMGSEHPWGVRGEARRGPNDRRDL